MVQGYIYRHWIINDEGVEKSYIGQTTKQKAKYRWNDGKGYLKEHCLYTKFANAIKKYGWKNFSHEIVGIVESDTKEQLIRDLDEWEKYYIFKYDSFYNGYNSTTGGGNGLKSEETKKKIKEARKKQEPPFKGRHLSEESRKKISQAMKGKSSQAKSVICITTGEIFDSTQRASEHYELDKSSIAKCCKGKLKSCGKHPITGEKLIWEYYEKDE